MKRNDQWWPIRSVMDSARLAERCRAYSSAEALKRLARKWKGRGSGDGEKQWASRTPSHTCHICGKNFTPKSDNQRKAELCTPCIWGR